MSKKTTQRTFNVCVEVKLDLGVEVNAQSLEEAIELVRKMAVLDVVDIMGNDHNDSSIKVTGVWECR